MRLYVLYVHSQNTLLFKLSTFPRVHFSTCKMWVYILMFVVFFFTKYFISIQTIPHWFYLETIFTFNFLMSCLHLSIFSPFFRRFLQGYTLVLLQFCENSCSDSFSEISSRVKARHLNIYGLNSSNLNF